MLEIALTQSGLASVFTGATIRGFAVFLETQHDLQALVMDQNPFLIFLADSTSHIHVVLAN